MTSILSRGSLLLRRTTPLNHSPFPNHLRRLVSSHRTLRASMADANGLVRFPLSSTSSLVIQRGDLTKWFVDGSSDAIVSTSSLSLSLSLSLFLFPFVSSEIGGFRVYWILVSGFVISAILTLCLVAEKWSENRRSSKEFFFLTSGA